MQRGLSQRTRFSLLEFLFWCWKVAFGSFFTVYLHHKGIPASAIGICLSVSSLFGLVGQAFWGYLTDKLASRKKFFIMLIVLSTVFIELFSITNSTFSILLVAALYGFCQMLLPVLLDTWLIGIVNGDSRAYGKVRSFGTIGFCVFSLFFGYLIDIMGIEIIFFGAFVLAVVGIIVAVTVNESAPEKSVKKNQLSLVTTIKMLYANSEFSFLSVVSFIICMATSTMFVMLPMVVQNLNGTSFHIGLVSFTSVILEVVAYRYHYLLRKKLGIEKAIAVSCIIYSIEFFIIAAFAHLWVLIIVVFWQGFAYGNYLIGLRIRTSELFDDTLSATAQSYADLPNLVACIIGPALGGAVLEYYGTSALVGICGGFTLLAACLLIIKSKIKHSCAL